MATLHVIEGPVGAGKTTYANRLARETGAAPLVLDEWMATLFRPDRPAGEIWDWYAERKQRCITQIWHLAQAQLALGTDAIVELGLIRRAERRAFCAQARSACVTVRLHALDLPEAERRRRVQARNRDKGETFAMEVSDEVFAMASALWEPIDAAEQAECEVVFVDPAR